MDNATRILLVEDSPGDARLALEAFREQQIPCAVAVVGDGEEALSYVFGRPPHVGAARPDLVLLDLNLPKCSGLEVLQAMKRDEKLRHIPVIILSSSRRDEDVDSCYDNYANAYLAKPVDLDEFLALARAIDGFWLESVRLSGGL